MPTFKSFEEDLSNVNEDNFENIALSLFRWQAQENKTYGKYLTYLGVNSKSIRTLDQIPFLPISFFKEHDVVTGEWSEETTFYSSATTGMVPSRHKVKSQQFYLENSVKIFTSFYGPLTDFHILALLPSYLERKGSSLVTMAQYFIDQSRSPHSAFYLDDLEQLRDKLSSLRDGDKKVLLFGVSFALMDFAEKYALSVGNCVVMETGGMKGRRDELTREEMHRYLCDRFKVKSIHSEYGMTELLSQSYSRGEGYFRSPPWMKILVRGINDPFEPLGVAKTGGINVIDLSNIYTCAFVETQDLGRIRQDGSFEVLGRIDNSDMRGCNLLVG